MKWKDLRIRAKIGSGFAIIISMILIAGFVILYNLQVVDREINSLSDVYIPAVSEASKLDSYWREANGFSRSYDFTGNAYFLSRSDSSLRKMEAALHKLSAVLADKKEEIIKRGINLDVIKEYLEDYKGIKERYVRKTQLFEKNLVQQKILLSEVNTMGDRYRNYTGVQSVLRDLNLVVAKFFLQYKERNLVNIDNELQTLEALNTKIHQAGLPGDLKNRIQASVSGLTDLINDGVAAKGLELKRFELSKNITWEVRAASDIGVDQIMEMGGKSATIVKLQKEILIYTLIVIVILWFVLVYFLAMAISQPIERGIQLAARVAEGDLSVTFEVDRNDEVGKLSQALNSMVNNLKKMMIEITHSAEEIVGSSRRLNQEASELSEGATEQASAAEEVSSSMEEMYANIQQNTENSKQTEKIAELAADGIKESNESSQVAARYLEDITNKVGVIGDIAFQTNILALNAAVEAARAGQEGRGFAVVAAEVRKLAERSQQAAVEINNVSSQTLESSLVASGKLNEISPEIAKTADLVKEITVASLEQVTGVEQINNALQQLNQITQRNAANADEINSASRHLNDLSEALTSAISVFRMSDSQVESPKSEKAEIKTDSQQTSNKVLAEERKRSFDKKTQQGIRFDLGKNLSDLDQEYEKF
ncbi:methyl-accepting chemotaxis protein [Marinilabiliaceae bacterium JC017]|nr:methyl-accepting chemotaxis protein [Marinilabiliaceae bacterium JC017]